MAFMDQLMQYSQQIQGNMPDMGEAMKTGMGVAQGMQQVELNKQLLQQRQDELEEKRTKVAFELAHGAARAQNPGEARIYQDRLAGYQETIGKTYVDPTSLKLMMSGDEAQRAKLTEALAGLRDMKVEDFPTAAADMSKILNMKPEQYPDQQKMLMGFMEQLQAKKAMQDVSLRNMSAKDFATDAGKIMASPEGEKLPTWVKTYLLKSPMEYATAMSNPTGIEAANFRQAMAYGSDAFSKHLLGQEQFKNAATTTRINQRDQSLALQKDRFNFQQRTTFNREFHRVANMAVTQTKTLTTVLQKAEKGLQLIKEDPSGVSLLAKKEALADFASVLLNSNMVTEGMRKDLGEAMGTAEDTASGLINWITSDPGRLKSNVKAIDMLRTMGERLVDTTKDQRSKVAFNIANQYKGKGLNDDDIGSISYNIGQGTGIDDVRTATAKWGTRTGNKSAMEPQITMPNKTKMSKSQFILRMNATKDPAAKEAARLYLQKQLEAGK